MRCNIREQVSKLSYQRDLQFPYNQSREEVVEFATNWTIVVRPRKRGIHLSIFYISPNSPLLNIFRVFLQYLPFPSQPSFSLHVSSFFTPLSASFFEISLWFTATLPLLFFLHRFLSARGISRYFFLFFPSSSFSRLRPFLFIFLFFFPFWFSSAADFVFALVSPPSSFLARLRGANPRFRRGNMEIEHRNEPIERSAVCGNRCATRMK